MEEEYGRFRAAEAGSAEEGPEALVRARWSLANYYQQLRCIVAGFEPEVPLEEMPLQERERLARVVRKVDRVDAAEIAIRVEEVWQSARSQFPVSAGENLLARLREKVLRQR